MPITFSHINNLPLPDLLIHLINENKWKHPGNDVMKKTIPFFHEEIDFLFTETEFKLENSSLYLEDEIFFCFDSKKSKLANNLPYLASDLSILIAVNKIPGDDLGIALDYRTSFLNPRIIANNWHSGIRGCPWIEISPTFEAFIKNIGLI